MTPTAQLTGSHLRTYQTIFQHPVSHNLGWHDVHALFRQVAEVEEKPDPNGYFALVVPALQGAGQILLFGSGTGSGSEMDQFAAWLGLHHRELAKRIIGSHVVDQHHLTEAQLLAQAREFFTNPQPSAA